jgi:hypothetical protein
MILQELVDLLNNNPTKTLRFEFQAGRFVESHYHITEIKNHFINSIDCGGRPDAWNETVIQLWEPSNPNDREPMDGKKAASILRTVDKIQPLELENTIYFEYTDGVLPVSIYQVGNFSTTDDAILISFAPISTQCKPSLELEMAGAEAGCCGPKKSTAGGCC